MVLALILTNAVNALEDPWVRENFYDMGMGWVDGNAYISTTAPDDLEDMLLQREWAELVDVEVLSDREAAELAGVEVDFELDAEGAAEAVHDALDGDGRQWAHYGPYGAPDSQWFIVPEESPIVGPPPIDEADETGEDDESGGAGIDDEVSEY